MFKIDLNKYGEFSVEKSKYFTTKWALYMPDPLTKKRMVFFHSESKKEVIVELRARQNERTHTLRGWDYSYSRTTGLWHARRGGVSMNTNSKKGIESMIKTKEEQHK